MAKFRDSLWIRSRFVPSFMRLKLDGWSSLEEVFMELTREGASLDRDAFESDVDGGGTSGGTVVQPTHAAAADQAVANNVDNNTVANNTIVLQPKQLTGPTGTAFMTSVQSALQQASVVLVDLIWIEAIEATGLAMLTKAMQLAHRNGKTLSFLSMDATTRQQLDDFWEADRARVLADQDEVFAPDFEQFLVNYQSRKTATLFVMAMAANRRR
jgi:anti-anti-sigma regulatory factor